MWKHIDEEHDWHKKSMHRLKTRRRTLHESPSSVDLKHEARKLRVEAEINSGRDIYKPKNRV